MGKKHMINRSPRDRGSLELGPQLARVPVSRELNSPVPQGAVMCTSDLEVHVSCYYNNANKESATAFEIHFGNIRGIKINLNAVHQHLENRSPEFLVLTETKVVQETEENQFYFNKYRFESQFISQRGVCVFIKENIAYTRTEKYEIKTDLAHSIVLKITFPSKVLFLISLYRSPQKVDNPSEFFIKLSSKVDEINSKYPTSELIIVGDFNVHHSDWLRSSSTDDEGKHAKFFAASHNLSQIVNQPTFIPHSRNHASNLLDLCLTSIPTIMKANVESGIGNSDHRLVTTSVQIVPPPENLPPTRHIWNFSKGDYVGLGKFYEGFPWEMHCFGNQNEKTDDSDVKYDINSVVQKFTDTVLHGMSRYIPNSYVTSKVKKKFSKKSAKAVREKKCAFNKYLKNKISYEEYRAIRNHSSKVCDEEARKIDKAKADKAASYTISDRQFYKLVGSVAKNDTKPSLPPLQSPDGSLVSNPIDKANLLANLFAQNSTLENPTNQTPPDIPVTDSSMKPLRFRKRVVYRLLKSLNTNKASGPDGVPSRILKRYARIFAPVLNKIFTLSYSSGNFPSTWKYANVQPVPKRGDKTDPSNYRPISIISVISKVFEKYVNDHIISYLEDNKIVSDKQYGFRQTRSSGDLLTYVSHLWSRALAYHGETFAIALDISKAFDMVWHQNLLHKLRAYGFDNHMIKWIGSFLNHRKISVVVDGFSSDPKLINAGVPQGSVLSPTLFLLYINDLLEQTINKITSYADDTNLHASHSSSKPRTHNDLNADRSDVVNSINADLETIFEWGEQNLVKFNNTKTQLCTISIRRSKNPHSININGNTLKECEKVRLLGVEVCSGLKWNEHIQQLASSAAKKLGFLNRCRKYFTSRQVLQIYKSFIRPCMEYCSQVWGGAARTTLKMLDSVQKRAIKIIRNPQITKDLDTLQHRRDVADLSVFYKYYHGRCSDEIKSVMPNKITVAPKHDTRQFSIAHNYRVDRITPRINMQKGDFFVRTCEKWNDLPQDVFPPNFNLQCFKVRVHKHLTQLRIRSSMIFS